MSRKTKRQLRARPVIGWAGIIDGKIDEWIIDNDGKGGQLGIWRTRAAARKRYEGVRKVEIRFVPTR